MYVWQRALEGIKHHLPVLFADDLVPYTASWIDLLLTDCPHFCDHLGRLALENAFEDTSCIVDQVRHRLLECTLRRHVDRLDDQLTSVSTLGLLLDDRR